MAGPEAPGADFPHLNLLFRDKGPARFHGGGQPDPRVAFNKQNRQDHSCNLQARLETLTRRWAEGSAERDSSGLPPIKGGIPFIVELASGLDLDELVSRFKLDVVAEESVSAGDQTRRYVLVAAEQIVDSELLRLIKAFADEERGSASVASMVDIVDDPSSPKRIGQILSPSVNERWPFPPNEVFILDVSFQTRGVMADLGAKPRKSPSEAETDHEKRVSVWFKERRTALYHEWDEFTLELEGEVDRFVQAYQGEIVKQWEDQSIDVSEAIAEFPDSVSFRIRMCGAGFCDLILNHPRIFEVVEPDEVAGHHAPTEPENQPVEFELLPPSGDSPLVCIVDSGIQEGHRLLRPAIKAAKSICLVPGKAADEISDEVRDGGHGTSVAGAVLYPVDIPTTGSAEAPCWLGNARVLDANNAMTNRLYPPSMLERIVGHFDGCRLFVHSINSRHSCRLRHMSAWAAKIDDLSHRNDVLFFISAGNLRDRQSAPGKGFLDHLEGDVIHPDYLLEDSARIATPAQSLQAMVVGSIAHADFDDGSWVSVAEKDEPSAFSRCGFGIWDTIKPDVVEYGGDFCVPKAGSPSSATTPPDVCPHLVRSTSRGGPETARDKSGTSFAAPKVAALAAVLARQFPDQTTLLYRALIAQSARWPKWAEELPIKERGKAFRMIGYGRPDWQRALHNAPSRVTLVTNVSYELKAGEAAVFEVPVPQELRAAGDDIELRVDVTLSYVTEPRRTRASLRGYQAVWLDWRSTKMRETMQRFIARMWTDEDGDDTSSGRAMPWMLGFQDNHGQSRDVSRRGTLQKDWAHLPAFDLGDSLGIAVRGHKGWNQGDPEATAKFVLTVSFEAMDSNVRVYEPVRVAVESRLEVPATRIRV